MALENKLAEERISKQKTKALFDSGSLNNLEAGTFESLVQIHNYLFDSIYDFAGRIRAVNLSKGNFRFTPVMDLKIALQNIGKMP